MLDLTSGGKKHLCCTYAKGIFVTLLCFLLIICWLYSKGLICNVACSRMHPKCSGCLRIVFRCVSLLLDLVKFRQLKNTVLLLKKNKNKQQQSIMLIPASY